MSEPWIGQHYDATRLLLLGESAYSWAEDGETKHPSDRHSCDLVEWAIADFEGCRSGGLGFIVTLSRALAGEESPSRERLRYVWDRVAFTNYVTQPVGLGSRVRPSAESWEEARNAFPRTVEQLKPSRIIVLGLTMWGRMPSTQLYFTDYMQAYRRSDGVLSFGYAVNHPSAGLGWRDLAPLIHFTYGNELSDL